jgi:hypothetical protein
MNVILVEIFYSFSFIFHVEAVQLYSSVPRTIDVIDISSQIHLTIANAFQLLLFNGEVVDTLESKAIEMRNQMITIIDAN